MLAAIFAMLVVGSFADESMQALAADDESVAINLLQHKGTAQAEADDVEEMVDAEMAVEMSAPGAAFLEEGEGRFRIVSGMISSLLRAEESGIMPLAAEVLGDHSAARSTVQTPVEALAVSNPEVPYAADQVFIAAGGSVAWPCACELRLAWASFFDCVWISGFENGSLSCLEPYLGACSEVKAEGAQPGATRFDFNALEATRGRLQVLQTQLAELSSGVAQAEAAKAAVEEEARRLEAKENDNQLCLREFEVEVQARQQELGESVAAAARLPTAEALSEEEQRLRERLVTVEEGVSNMTMVRFLLNHGFEVNFTDRWNETARYWLVKRPQEAAQYRESALSQQLQSFKAELTMIEWALEVFGFLTEETRSNALAFQGRRVQGVPQRARECEVEVQILRKRAEEIEKRQEALQEKRELERNQEQAERQLATLSAELAVAHEARFELLRKSVLEDIALPFGGPPREAKNAAKKLSAALVADLDAPLDLGKSSPAEAAAELRVDFSKLPQAKRKAATGGPATKLLEDEYRAELRRLAVDLEQLKPNLKAIAQLEAIDQEALHAEREAGQESIKRLIVEKIVGLKPGRREKFMGCFRKVQDEIQHVYKRAKDMFDTSYQLWLKRRCSPFTRYLASCLTGHLTPRFLWPSMGGAGDASLAALQAENAELKKQLSSKVWTMTLATVLELEKRAMEGSTNAERVTLPYRIASLERSVFGSTASEDDLNKIASLQTDYLQLQKDYESLADEYQELKDRPPQVIESSASVKMLEEQVQKLQERYQAVQQKMSKLRVQHLELETQHSQLQAEHEKLKEEAAKAHKHQSAQVGRLRREHEKLAEELQQVRGAYAEAQAQLEKLRKEHSALLKDAAKQRDLASEMARLKGEYQELMQEFQQLQDDHDQLQEKNNRFRSTWNGAWGAEEADDKNLLTLPPLPSPSSRCHTPNNMEKSHGLSKSEPKIPGLQETKEARSPSSLLEPAGPLKVEHLKTRLMEIKGRVLYCNDKWQEQHIEKPQETKPRRMELEVFDVS
ncbi:hypothetical protein AK812_SmicGene26308 [Symbiodinium microadriaticum]|uniref:Uncharacterized protein n=2 Tax=Symbiodinium TaxID=2949 RepID=A0A1Q9D9R4_SYMMI|nr:hypothetical protein AK812_SmicGene26308 [Symbiodinium microadriaticum]